MQAFVIIFVMSILNLVYLSNDFFNHLTNSNENNINVRRCTTKSIAAIKIYDSIDIIVIVLLLIYYY
jgi:hypothetical protein